MTDDSQAPWWFDATALTRRPRLGLSRLRGDDTGALTAFARANGLRHETEPHGSIVSFGPRERAQVDDLVTFAGRPEVEFGNCGSSFSVDFDHLPPRFGFIAVRHGLDLPLLTASFHGVVGAKTIGNVGTLALNVLGTLAADSSDHAPGPYARFRAGSVTLLRARSDGVTVNAAEQDEAAARALLTPPVVAELTELSRSFLVEIRRDWAFAHSFYGDVSTTDPEVWAWVFSVASRMLDLTHGWQQAWPPLDPTVPGRAPDPRAVPFYTAQRVPRPRRLDGVLSRSSLSRLKPGT